MGTLLDLIASLTPAPPASTAPLIEVTCAPAANDPEHSASEPQHFIRTAATATAEWPFSYLECDPDRL